MPATSSQISQHVCKMWLGNSLEFPIRSQINSECPDQTVQIRCRILDFTVWICVIVSFLRDKAHFLLSLQKYLTATVNCKCIYIVGF